MTYELYSKKDIINIVVYATDDYSDNNRVQSYG